MPGTGLADFFNPLRLYGEAGLRAVDIFFDVILPELASSLDEPNALVSREQMDAVRQRGDRFFTDPEAEFIRRQLREVPGSQPTHPFPGGGELPDVTWAFNQATGARPGATELANESEPDWRRQDGATTYILDPLSGRPIFPINANLPSLNRQPGIIFVPIGLFPILGTIRLYGGQQIVGVSAGPDGSRLVKYGDGACIQTHTPANVLDEPHLTTDDAMARATQRDARVRIGGLVTSLRERMDQMYRVESVAPVRPEDDPSPEDEPAPWWEPNEVKRRLILERSLLTGETRGWASVRIAGLAIDQMDWNHADPRFALNARPPFIDELSDLTRARGETVNTGGLRTEAIVYSSMGIELLSAGLSVVEDCAISGFRKGMGIRSRARTYSGGAQIAYYNQIRHCQVSDCFVGISLDATMSFGFVVTDQQSNEETTEGGVGEHGTRTAAGLRGAQAGANSTAIFDCTISSSLPAAQVRAGVELWSGTTWLYFCRILMAEGDCILDAGSSCAYYRCELQGPRHILTATNTIMEQANQAQGTSQLQLVRFQHARRSAFLEYFFYCRFLDSAGMDVQPVLQVMEFPERPANAQPEIRARFVERVGASQANVMPTLSSELPGPTFSPQSGWTSENLLKNAAFDGTAPPAAEARPALVRWPEAEAAGDPERWQWHIFQPAPVVQAVVAEVRNLDEPAYVGPVLELRLDIEAMMNGAPTHELVVGDRDQRLRLFQELVPHIEQRSAGPVLQEAWRRRNRIRGTRLIGAARVWANYPGAVAVDFGTGMSGSGNVAKSFNWKPNDWLRVTTWRNVLDFDYAPLVPELRGNSIHNLSDFRTQGPMAVREARAMGER